MTIDMNQLMVRDFMLKILQPVRNLPTIDVSDKEKILRIRLILEECVELIIAMSTNNLVEIADGLADTQYILYGAANMYGIDLQNVFEEVNKSNMTKSVEDGGEDSSGKVLKGKDYIPPNIEKILKEQLEIGSWNQELFNPTSDSKELITAISENISEKSINENDKKIIFPSDDNKNKISLSKIPIYCVNYYVIICDNIDDQRRIMNSIFGEPQEEKFECGALLSYDKYNFGIFLERFKSDMKCLSHEIFHCTHRIIEFVNSRFDTYNHEHVALLNGYLTELTFKEIKRLDLDYYKYIVNV